MIKMKSVFVKTFGETPLIKVIDFLLERDVFDYSKSDIAKSIGISRVTLNKFWSELVEKGIVKEHRKIGRATLYILNKDSPIVKKLLELDFVISKQYNDQILTKQKVPVSA